MNRQGVEWKYPDLVYREDFRVVNEGKKNEIFEWNTEKYPKPTDAETQQWFNEFKYQQERKYPAITEQLDLLYHDIDGGRISAVAKTSSWFLAIKAVKDANPKGG